MNNQINIYTDLLLKLSKKALSLGELPVSAIIVDPVTKKVVSACINHTKKNPILHAEINAILKALKLTNLERLDKFDIYCSLEPCPMCTSAISISRIRRVYFCLEDKKSGGFINGPKLIYSKNLHHKPKFYYGFKENVFLNLMKNFFKKKRN
ncbi:MAG: nucleoside deaminase [Candidatus Fonsibacter sp.]|nr:nucleoside deaminase [Pseudomonadota bacterium]NCU45060.1 nucleoside deaminase [Candidatus Fonsibacter ubiquis]NCU45842.1 nucleoside deaminase [Candidatus Fonsibacter ubiquis]NCU47844.1 nucleoside deaminase [Candidatus Fonsibacter ubiquis]NCU49707.1 nucleoside deaminase [Candidatus Fonsibacter ubiquis]